MLLGGIGFDQIPAVRVWAEQHHELYIHHIATQQGTAGLRYSYTMLPTLEQVGTSFGQYYLAHDANLKIGIVYRNSSNWDPGRLAFVKTLQDAGKGANIVDQEPVSNNQGDYSSQIVKMKAQADVVLIWENALAAEQFIQQSSNQGWKPNWLLFPFNLTLKTLDQAGVDTTKMEGVGPWPAYTCKASSLPEFSTYRAELERFEAAYAKYDSGANLCGDGGDLLFTSWQAWEQVADLLVQCGRDCTRNKMAGLMLSGYHATIGANCPVDFRGDGHHGGGPEDTFKVGQFNGARGWYNTAFCMSRI
jgi:ABC-type branched-subunit amino acid transport system substrate-binding protein